MALLVPYHPQWPEVYQEESARVTAVFDSESVAIHHIGSTAVPGIERSKPCIDMTLEVLDISKVDRFNDAMVELGYEPRGEHGIPGRRYFAKDIDGTDAVRTFHLHAFQTEHPEIERHINFRDYLIAHPQTRSAYSRLKVDLSKEFPGQMMKYTDGKTKFIREIDRRAAEWRSSGQHQ